MIHRYLSIRLVLFLTVTLAVIGLFLISLYRVSSPHLLIPKGGAHWFVTPILQKLDTRPVQPQFAAFRSMVQVSSIPRSATAQLQSLGQAELLINDQLVVRTRVEHGLLNSASIDLAPYIKLGINEIVVIVSHTHSPAAILFYWLTPGLLPIDDWQVSADGGINWEQARLTEESMERSPDLLQLSGPKGLLAYIEILLFLAILGGVVAFLIDRNSSRANAGGGLIGLRTWRWLLIISLASLYMWNFNRLPLGLGMDLLYHLEYVDFILIHKSLPFADQGWQMFQPPLAYLLAVVMEPLCAAYAPGLDPPEALRILTILCSLGIAWIGCRICEISFKHSGTAAAAMVVATFLPVNLYMGQAFGNEPFAALFGSLLILESVRLIKGTQISPAVLLRIGLWFGLGLLSKPTVLLLFPAVLLVVMSRKQIKSTALASLRSASVILLVSACISGWWYVRNVLHFGRPFVGGWEVGRSLDWWQYPGFRIPEHWQRFGESLVAPFHSGLDSFWDSIYSTIWLDGNLSGQIVLNYAPPWNLYPMAGLALFSLPILALMFWGAVHSAGHTVDRADRSLALFAGGNIVIFLMAMAYIFGQEPSYSAAKGSYLLSTITCLPILLGLGVNPLMKHVFGRVAVFAFLAAWVGLVILAFAVC